MTDLSVSYMGVELKNPLVVGACSLSKMVDTIKEVEQAGAGGLVIKSLFEEQVHIEAGAFEAEMARNEQVFSEAVSMFPNVPHGGPEEHVYWIKETRKAVSMPLFASLNATSKSIWVDWAKRLEETGVDGLELNFYSLPVDERISSADVEEQELSAFAAVREAVKIPIAVKLHQQYTSLMHMVHQFDELGANAVVLFNRFFQPDVDVDTESERCHLQLSVPADSLPALRWTGLLHQRIGADIVASGGLMTGKDIVRMLLAGANSVQVVSALYKHKLGHIETMLVGLEEWMNAKGYTTIDDFRGKASKANVGDPWAFERGQYIKAILGFD